MEETGLRRKNKEAKRVKSYDGGASKGRLEIQEKPKKFLQNFIRLVMIGCRILRLKRKKVLAHLVIRQLVESMARRIMVIAFLG